MAKPLGVGLLGLEGMTRDELLELLQSADAFVGDDGHLQTPGALRGALDGVDVALLFWEPSTRTRASFELAVHRLGGYPLALDMGASSVVKGETELDTCANLAAMGVRGFVIRHSERGTPRRIYEHLGLPVLNAGDGTGEHPTQALLDVFTLRRALGRVDLEGVRVAIVGDIVHSRVARSDVYALRALGASVVLAGPRQLLPARQGWDAEFAESRAGALDGADAVIVLRVQQERMHRAALSTEEYVRDWGLDDAAAEAELRAGAYVMHPGPVVRGYELSSDVADGARSLILQQAKFGVAVRQAALMRAFAPGQ